MFWDKKKPKKRKKQAMRKPAPKPVIRRQTSRKANPNKIRSDSTEHSFAKSIKDKPNQHKTVEKKPKLSNTNAKKEFLSTFGKLTYRHRAWDIWHDFIVMFACALSNPVDKSHYDEREKRYLKIIKKYDKQEQELFPQLVAHTVMALENDPEQDFLGDIFMELKLGDGKNGQFFTPYHICELMAKMTMEDTPKEVERKGYVTIYDCCCGAGATLIAGVNEARRLLEKENLNYQNHVLVVAQDVDEIVALMCYIQLFLLGVAAIVKVGNTFTDPIAENDSKENYWFTMMYFSDIWTTRRLIHKMDDILKDNSDIKEEP